MTNRVDEDTRRANRRAVVVRDKWRSDYALLVDMIKQAKRNVRVDPVGKAPKLHLRYLQAVAQTMMDERELIQFVLDETAYEYV